MNSTTLYSYGNTSITLAEAYTAWDAELSGAAVLCYSAMSCTVMTFEELKDYTFNNAAPFELRIFNSNGELRWLADTKSFDANNSTKNPGSAVYLTEKENIDALENWEKSEDKCVCTRGDCYALWGEYERAEDNDYVFFEHRVGELTITKSLLSRDAPQSGRKAGLTVKEYIAVTDKHGNCSVVAERLCGLDLFTKKQG